MGTGPYETDKEHPDRIEHELQSGICSMHAIVGGS